MTIRDRYRSVDAVVYITNHYVEISESPDASLLRALIYKTYPSDNLHNFVDELGRKWRWFQEEKLGPFDNSREMETINWERAHVVRGVYRVERYQDGDE